MGKDSLSGGYWRNLCPSFPGCYSLTSEHNAFCQHAVAWCSLHARQSKVLQWAELLKSLSPDPRDEGRGLQPFSTTLWCRFWTTQSPEVPPALHTCGAMVTDTSFPLCWVTWEKVWLFFLLVWNGVCLSWWEFGTFLYPVLRRGRLPQDTCTPLRLYFLLFQSFLYFSVNHTE